MEFVADFHIHSKYSRATSRDMDVEHLAQWAKLKGIQLMGTGDFTHHLWLQELKNKLEDAGNGLYAYKGIRFILTSEISSIYSKKGRSYRIHNMVIAPSFKTVDAINDRLATIGNLASDGRPILGLDAAELARIVFTIDPACVLIPGHIWTPWFSLFGSMSGFDRIQDCFEEQTPKIFALETGLSSDPAMNWRLSALDRFSLISNSDSHSPAKIGREANVFNCELSYQGIMDALRAKDPKRFLYTIEFYPEEGKYHYDGHRLCGVRLSPSETKAHNTRCPKCNKPVTVGVMNRVEQLADRPAGFKPDNAIPYKNLIPLDEVIADVRGIGKLSQAIETEYRKIIAHFGTELDVLIKAGEPELFKGMDPAIAQAIVSVRSGKVSIQAGYDGEYGKISIPKEPQAKRRDAEEQLNLF